MMAKKNCDDAAFANDRDCITDTVVLDRTSDNSLLPERARAISYLGSFVAAIRLHTHSKTKWLRYVEYFTRCALSVSFAAVFLLSIWSVFINKYVKPLSGTSPMNGCKDWRPITSEQLIVFN